MTSGGVHATAVLDAGIPVDSVARCIGDDAGTTASGGGPRKMANVLARFRRGIFGEIRIWAPEHLVIRKENKKG
jgi:hypothetical protein